MGGSDSNWTNCTSSPLFPGGRGVRPDYCDGDLDILSETESKTESKTDWHNSASSTQEQIPQTPRALLHHGNRYEMAAAPGASLWTTGGAYQESSCSGNSGSDIFLHQQNVSMSVQMRGSIPVHAQPLQPGLQLSGRHASIREARSVPRSSMPGSRCSSLRRIRISFSHNLEKLACHNADAQFVLKMAVCVLTHMLKIGILCAGMRCAETRFKKQHFRWIVA